MRLTELKSLKEGTTVIIKRTDFIDTCLGIYRQSKGTFKGVTKYKDKLKVIVEFPHLNYPLLFQLKDIELNKVATN